MLAICYCCVWAGWNDSLWWYGVLSTLHYFYITFTSVYYTGIYTGKVAVVAILFPIRVGTSCSDLYLLYLCIYVLLVLYLTDQLAVRGLSADLSVIYGSACLAVLFL